MSEREKQVLAFIISYIEENGESPMYREIGAFFGISRERVRQFIVRLEAKGLITYEPRKVRSIRTTFWEEEEMKRELSKSQRRTLETIIALVKENGYPPTVREISVADGLTSHATVTKHLEALRKKGYITYEPRKQRTIQVLKSPDE